MGTNRYVSLDSNSPATFQSMMNALFDDLQRRMVIIYMDDILIFSEDLEGTPYPGQKRCYSGSKMGIYF